MIDEDKCSVTRDILIYVNSFLLLLFLVHTYKNVQMKLGDRFTFLPFEYKNNIYMRLQ